MSPYVLCGKGSLNLDHATWAAGLDFRSSRHHLLRELEDRFGVRGILAFEHYRSAAVARLANFRIERNASQE